MSELDGRTFLVTGGNTGIGRATATGLAQRGGRVWIAARSWAKGEAAVAAIKAETGSDSVWFLPLDLADLESVGACAAAFLALGEPLHVLVNNAGVAGRRGLTRQGFELMFGVNHLGHFVLTDALLGCLTASAPARVVTVSSDAHYSAHGHRLRGAAATRARYHRTARVRGLQAVQRAVHAGTRPPRGGHRGHHVRAAPGGGGVGHLAAGAVAGPPDHHRRMLSVTKAPRRRCTARPRRTWRRTAACSTTSARSARRARWRRPSWPQSCGSTARRGPRRYRGSPVFVATRGWLACAPMIRVRHDRRR